jgi:GDPmannose 4,6-dehydratase
MPNKIQRKKIALIFGVTGQDGSYLSRLLLNKGYQVHGVKRRSSSLNTQRIDDIYEDIHDAKNFFLHYGDLTDGQSINQLINKIKPFEIFNLAAQSHVAVSFELPEYSMMTNSLGTLKILEAIKNINPKIRYYQAGTSDMFGSSPPPQSEKTPFYPRSPYAISKLAAHWMTINYREAYGIYACNGILFNHESPVRGETFVTQKIIKALINIKYKKQKKLYLGNLYAKRDWGHAEDYVYAMWLMLQQKKPQDFVIATGQQYSVKDFINFTAKKLQMPIVWKGNKLREKAYYNNHIIIEIDPKYFRPSEVDSLKGDATKAKKILKWKPKFNIDDLIIDMIKTINKSIV